MEGTTNQHKEEYHDLVVWSDEVIIQGCSAKAKDKLMVTKEDKTFGFCLL